MQTSIFHCLLSLSQRIVLEILHLCHTSLQRRTLHCSLYLFPFYLVAIIDGYIFHRTCFSFKTVNVVPLTLPPVQLIEFKLFCKLFPISLSYSSLLPKSTDFLFKVTTFQKVLPASLIWSLINNKIKAHFVIKPKIHRK